MSMTDATPERNREAIVTRLAAQAVTAYPAEAKRIRCAMQMVLDHRVYLVHDGICFVESQSQQGMYYRLERNHCYCAATVARCAHVWARALLKRLIAEQDIPTEAPTPTRYHAQYYPYDSTTPLEGEAYEDPEGQGWVFLLDGTPAATFVDRYALILLGEVGIAEAQRTLDGDYVKKVCGY